MGSVGYSCISVSLSCALGCVGTSREMTSDFDLHSEVMQFSSVWLSARVVLGIWCICCTMGMYGGFAVELRALNLGSGSLRNVDEISIQGSVCA